VPPSRLQKIRKRMVVPPSIRVLRSHARLAKSAAALLLIHWLEMHLISIQGFDWNVVLYILILGQPLAPDPDPSPR